MSPIFFQAGHSCAFMKFLQSGHRDSMYRAKLTGGALWVAGLFHIESIHWASTCKLGHTVYYHRLLWTIKTRKTVTILFKPWHCHRGPMLGSLCALFSPMLDKASEWWTSCIRGKVIQNTMWSWLGLLFPFLSKLTGSIEFQPVAGKCDIVLRWFFIVFS